MGSGAGLLGDDGSGVRGTVGVAVNELAVAEGARGEGGNGGMIADIAAPGENIEGCSSECEIGTLDGTAGGAVEAEAAASHSAASAGGAPKGPWAGPEASGRGEGDAASEDCEKKADAGGDIGTDAARGDKAVGGGDHDPQATGGDAVTGAGDETTEGAVTGSQALEEMIEEAALSLIAHGGDRASAGPGWGEVLGLIEGALGRTTVAHMKVSLPLGPG